MPRRALHRTLAAALLLAGAASVSAASAAPAASVDETREALEALDAQLAALQAWLDSSGGDREGLARALREADEGVAALAGARRDAARAVAEQREVVSTLDARIDALMRAEAAQREALTRQLRGAWLIARRPALQALLDARDPAEAGRALWLHDHVAGQRQDALDRWRTDREQLTVLRSEADAARSALAGRQAELETSAAQLQATRSERASLLDAIDERIRRTRSELTGLRSDRAALAELLERLVRDAGRLDGRAFVAARGRLPWPDTAGTSIVQRFGAPSGPGNVPADGVLIAAPAGSEVRAIAAGELVFAEWMRGFGLLAIVDHGGGYMSLYGQLELLTRQVGDRLEAGETLGSAGRSGGGERDGVWFEVRNQGSPEDPASWCRGRG